MRIDADLVRDLAELLSANALTEIEVADGDRRIRVKREAAVQMLQAHSPGPSFAAPAAPAVGAATPASESLGAQVAAAASPDAVKSPMVGTVFLSAEPGAAPFIAVGDTVAAGDTLMIIEAMKVMNPILAPKGGKITQILIADSQAVEFDQPLVVIE